MNGGLTLVAYGFFGSLYIPVLESWGIDSFNHSLDDFMLLM